tara:strand:- start:4730 stop:4987 length:258 start_codon:yes stop_codon:yes gene_type:complete
MFIYFKDTNYVVYFEDDINALHNYLKTSDTNHRRGMNGGRYWFSSLTQQKVEDVADMLEIKHSSHCARGKSWRDLEYLLKQGEFK